MFIQVQERTVSQALNKLSTDGVAHGRAEKVRLLNDLVDTGS